VSGIDAVSLIVACVAIGRAPWEMRQSAEQLARTLSETLRLEALVLLRRDLELFSGYYVRVRPQRLDRSRD
jgi:hypothetical protein